MALASRCLQVAGPLSPAYSAANKVPWEAMSKAGMAKDETHMVYFASKVGYVLDALLNLEGALPKADFLSARQQSLPARSEIACDVSLPNSLLTDVDAALRALLGHRIFLVAKHTSQFSKIVFCPQTYRGPSECVIIRGFQCRSIGPPSRCWRLGSSRSGRKTVSRIFGLVF